MDLRIFTEPQQGASYDQLLAVAQRAEANGFGGFFRSDHYLRIRSGDGQPGPTDTWITLGAIARETSTIRLGTMVCSATFRLPGPLAVAVAQVDEMSGGRVELGLGAGWNEPEHRELGLPFPPIGERADLMEEQFAVLRGLWGESDGWSFEGAHIRIEDASFHPKPIPRPGRPISAAGHVRPRLLTGGEGSPRSLRIAARYADEFNLSSSSPEKAVTKYAELRAACEAIGRDPATMGRSVMAGVLIGRNEAELSRRKAAMLAAFGNEAGGEDWFDAREPRWVFGAPDEARAMVARFADAGAERIMLQDFLPRDLEMVDLMAEALFG
jgi:F420-dependent oxidoreductase-like protein